MPDAPQRSLTVGGSVSGRPPTVREPVWRRLWGKWRAFAEVVGNFQARLLLGILYFVLVAPFALTVRLFADPLGVRRPRTTYWEPLPAERMGMEAARRQS